MSDTTLQEAIQHTHDMMVGLAISFLHRGVVNLTFTKADGSLRTARASLHPSHLPPVKESDEGKKERATNPGVVKFFDLDAQAWRSFKKENLVNVSVTDIIDHGELPDSTFSLS